MKSRWEIPLLLVEAFVIFGLAIITQTQQQDAISQQYQTDKINQVRNIYDYNDDYYILFTSTSSEDGDDDDEGDEETVEETATPMCNKYLETCPGEATTGTPMCNKLFESCPGEQSALLGTTPTPAPAPNATAAITNETIAAAPFTGATTDSSLSPTANVTCPQNSDNTALTQGVSSTANAIPDTAGNYTFLTKWDLQSSPAGLALDSTSDSIYVSDYGNNSIQKLNRDGTLLTTWGSQGSAEGQFANPEGVSADPCLGYVYVADTDNHRIQKFDRNGIFITSWGSQGSADGQFNHPYGVAADSSGSVVLVT